MEQKLNHVTPVSHVIATYSCCAMHNTDASTIELGICTHLLIGMCLVADITSFLCSYVCPQSRPGCFSPMATETWCPEVKAGMDRNLLGVSGGQSVASVIFPRML